MNKIVIQVDIVHYPAKAKKNKPNGLYFFGAEGGIWTHRVSRTILSRVRLPFRHFGLYKRIVILNYSFILA